MLRFIYTVLDLLAACCAILSPVAILHWLLLAIGINPQTPGILELSAFFHPLNALVDYFLHLPSLQFMAQSISLTQGILAISFTLLFFVFNFLAETLKTTEQKLDVSQQARAQQRRLQALENKRQREQRKVSTNKKTLVAIRCDFAANNNTGPIFEKNSQTHQGSIVSQSAEELLIEFPALENSLQYCLESSQSVLGHYATLRPMDPQPPFRMALHALDTQEASSMGFPKCEQLLKYAGLNYIVFSTEIKELLDAKRLSDSYPFQSLGIYQFQFEKDQEVFRLLPKQTP